MVGDHAVVIQQPDSAEEQVEVREALAGCPVNAIGDDGES